MTRLETAAAPWDGPEHPRSVGDLPDHFSFSSMSTFQNCPRKWRYHYLTRSPREFVPASLLVGGSLHAALERLHHAQLTGEAVGLDAALEAFETHWTVEAGEQEVRFGKGGDEDLVRRQARALLETYIRENAPTPETILGIEEEVSLRLTEMSVPIVGRVDLLVEPGDSLLVVDAKTSRSAFGEDKVAEGTAQLALYATALAPLVHMVGKPVRGRFVIFRRLKTPKIEVRDVDLTAAEITRTRRMLADTWSLIEAAHAADSFPAHPGWICKNCPYRTRCVRETGSPTDCRTALAEAVAV